MSFLAVMAIIAKTEGVAVLCDKQTKKAMRKKILIPTDFSDYSKNAIEYAIQLFSDEAVDLVLFNAIVMPIASVEPPFPALHKLEEASNSALDRLVEEYKPMLKSPDARLKTHVAISEGNVASGINRAYEDVEASLIIMGTQGASGVREFLLGSNTANLLKKTVGPVIAVPEGTDIYKMDKILMAADLQENRDRKLLEPLKEFARKFDSNITILTVARKNVLVGEDEVWESYNLHNEFKDIHHQYRVLEDSNPRKAIEEYANRADVNLLVTISRHNSFWERLFHTSVSGKLTMHANVPMLVLHDD